MEKEITIGAHVICGPKHLESGKRLLLQLSKFDQVVVIDTTPNQMFKEFATKGKPYTYAHVTWRPTPFNKKGDMIYDKNDWGFSYARNQAIALNKTTHFVWLDCDDLVGQMQATKEFIAMPEQAYKAFRKIAEEAPEDVDVWFADYVYSRDSANNPNVLHTRERMLKADAGWHWVYPIHECLVPSRKPHQAIIKDVQVIHYPVTEPGTSGDRNMKMMIDWHKQLTLLNDKADLQRASIVIGQGLWGQGKYKECADWLVREFVTKFPEVLDIEKFEAWTYVAKSQLELTNVEAAKAAALACIDIEPGLQDGYILLAQAKLMADEDPQDILTIIENAARQDEPPSQLIRNPHDYRFTPFCITSECKLKLGQPDEALKFAILARQENPHDPRPEGLRIRAADAVRRRDAVEAAKALYQLYQDYDEHEKADKLFQQLPYVAQESEEVIELANEAHKRVKHLYDPKTYKEMYEDLSHWQAASDEDILNETPGGIERYRYILGRLQKALPNGGTILDVGISDGFHSLLYAKHGYRVVGVDINKTCVDLANERAKKWNLPLVAVHGMFEDMEPTQLHDPFDPKNRWFQNFDAVVCSEVIEHVQDPPLFIGCLADCAKDHAPIIITTPDEQFDKGDIPAGMGMFEQGHDLAGHVRAFTQVTFEALLKSNPEYDVVESHFLPCIEGAYREHQGWQVGEIRRQAHADGPIIRMYCGPLMQTFSPDSINDGGVGGSETWAIHLAKIWADLGCQVVVYNDEKGIWDGVFYRPAEQYSKDHHSDIFISWRNPQIFEGQRPNATTTILMCHDMNYFYNIPDAWVENIDKIAVLSKWHEKWITERHPNFKGKTWLTANGIDPQRYSGKVEKVPHRYFYSSSPDRGLRELLDMWPTIRAAIPDAELHVCYGFKLAYEINKHLRRPDEIKRLMKIEADLARMKDLGVVSYDRIGQDKLAELQMSSEAWLYPIQKDDFGGFLETFCIGKYEAMAARCIPIMRTNGALPENIPHFIPWTNDLDIVGTLQNLDTRWKPEWTDENQKAALSLTWEKEAINWLRALAPVEETVNV